MIFFTLSYFPYYFSLILLDPLKVMFIFCLLLDRLPKLCSLCKCYLTGVFNYISLTFAISWAVSSLILLLVYTSSMILSLFIYDRIAFANYYYILYKYIWGAHTANERKNQRRKKEELGNRPSLTLIRINLCLRVAWMCRGGSERNPCPVYSLHRRIGMWEGWTNNNSAIWIRIKRK